MTPPGTSTLPFDGPVHLYHLKNRVDFKALGREKTALFLTISDTDRSMDKLVIPDFDKIISVIRSREIYMSLIIQSITQLYGLYGEHRGKTINNCDNCLYLGRQDVDTADFISVKTNKTRDKVLSMPLGDVWLFTRGQPAKQVRKYDLTRHPLYSELPEAGDGGPAGAPVEAARTRSG